MLTDKRGERHVSPAYRSDAPAVVLAEYLLTLRHLIAPRNSGRERLLRKLYVPVLNRMKARARLKASEVAPEPVVVRWEGITDKARKLPAHPRILILKLDHIGDFIVALPAFEQLRSAWPGASITLICGSWNRVWAEKSGLFDSVVEFDFFTAKSAEWRGPSPEQFAAFESLRPGHFDIAIDLRHDPDTRALLARVDAEFHAGFQAPMDVGGDCLDIALPDMEHLSIRAGTGRPLPAGLRLQLLAHAVTATFFADPAPAMKLIGPASRPTGERRYVILAPGAGAPIRVWPIPRLIKVGRAIADRHRLDIVVTGSVAERASAREIVAAFPDRIVEDMTGSLPLADLADLVKGASLYVGYDTGTTHLAAALGVPTVAILSGVPIIEVWQPVGARVVTVAGQTACSGCYLTRAAQCSYDVACLMAVSVEDVLQACEAAIGRGAEANQTQMLASDEAV